MTNETIPYFEDETSKRVPGLPDVERDNINAIIFNPKKNEVLCLQWTNFDWRTLIVGGVEKDEDMVLAATREIEEETGYTHVKFVAEIGKTRAGYYAAHKNENRIANATGLLFELVDEDRKEVSETETKTHTCQWVARDEVVNFLNIESQKYLWGKALEKLNVLPD